MTCSILPPPINNTIKGSRSVGLDIVRTIACITVIASHYFLYTNFNKYPFEGASMFFQGMLNGIVSGSDLYMILTGFLCCHKTPCRKFYYSGIKVVLSYVFFSILTIVVNIYIFHTGMSWSQGILGIFSFSTIPYAWYIEMWIGLFILAPFLNMWYKAIPTKNLKISLIVIIMAMTALPDFFNRYGMDIIPDYWEQIYPIGFYFCGSYIREYRPRVNRLLLLCIIIGITMISPSVTIISGHPTFLHIIGDRNGIFMAINALSIFLLFYSVELKHGFWSNVFQSISLRSLDIFLCSAIMDVYLYPLFQRNFYENQSQFGQYYFVIVPLIFIICYTIASIKRILFNLLDRILKAFNAPFMLQSHA